MAESDEFEDVTSDQEEKRPEPEKKPEEKKEVVKAPIIVPSRELSSDESDKETNDQKFVTELEFLQCLCNPNYLNYLATQGFFNDPKFINFLKYLQYWLQPEYAKYVKYSQSLAFLKLIQDPEFRLYLQSSSNTNDILMQQDRLWYTYWRDRQDHTIPEVKLIIPWKQN